MKSEYSSLELLAFVWLSISICLTFSSYGRLLEIEMPQIQFSVAQQKCVKNLSETQKQQTKLNTFTLNIH